MSSFAQTVADMSTRTLLSLFFLCLTVFPPALSATRESPRRDTAYLFIGNANYPPFIFQENSKPVGLIVDLTNAVIEKSGIDAQFVAMDWALAQSKVINNKADALVLINKTEERENLYSFSQALIKSEFFIFRKSARVDIRGLESLNGLTVGSEKGGYTRSLLQRFPEIRLHLISDLREGFQLLEQGQIDALVTEHWAGEFELAKRNVKDIVSLDTPIDSSTSYIAVRKGDHSLLEKINAGLQLIDADGTRRKIEARWSNKAVIHVTKENLGYYQVAVGLAFVTLVLLILLTIYVRKLSNYRKLLEKRVIDRTLELATARAVAESADAVKTRFMNNVSHEMRTPLQSIMGFAELGKITVGEAEREELESYFDDIRESGMRLHNLVESLLAIASKAWKDNAGHTHDRMQEIELPTFVLATSTLMQYMARRAGQELVLDQRATATQFIGDPIRLRQVFEHLMANAVRYSPSGAITTFVVKDFQLGKTRSETSIPAISFEVIDQGCGIPEKEISAVFEPFYESTRTANGAGSTGLGLPLSRCIVERHHGTISLTNNANTGVTCQVILPIALLSSESA